MVHLHAALSFAPDGLQDRTATAANGARSKNQQILAQAETAAHPAARRVFVSWTGYASLVCVGIAIFSGADHRHSTTR